MIFIEITMLILAAAIVAVVVLAKQLCWRCTAWALLAFLAGTYLANALVTGYLNIDAPSASRGAALATAICAEQLTYAQQPPPAKTINCSTFDTAIGTEVSITAATKLDEETQKKVMRRIQLLKAIITKRRVTVTFGVTSVAESGNRVGPDGKPYNFIRYKEDTYLTSQL